MESTYLPGTTRDRIKDLMKEHNVTQSHLALQIGITDSTLSRFISSKTDKLGDEFVIRIARAFNVSTDFLLGESDIPDRKNYDISELGLSVQAVRNLYTGKLNPNVVNRLFESPRFAEVTNLISQYLDDTLANGFAAQNAMFSGLQSTLLADAIKEPAYKNAAIEASNTIKAMKTPVYQADLTNIQNSFMLAIKEIKKEVGSDIEGSKAVSEKVTKGILSNMKKQAPSRKMLTPKMLADATFSQMNLSGASETAISNLKKAYIEVIESMPRDFTNGKRK